MRHHSDASNAMTQLIREVFRFNGTLIAAGDKLVSDIGLTSARWQVMGAIASSETPKPVAWIAQDMGLSRQAVQRVVNDLLKAGLVETQTNPYHARANYVVLTKEGMLRVKQAGERQAKWVEKLAQGFEVSDIKNASELLETAAKRLRTKDSGDTEN